MYDTLNKFRNAVLDYFDSSEEFKTEIKQFVGNKMYQPEAA